MLFSRERRYDELLELRRINPAKIYELYRQAAAKLSAARMPPEESFSRMIEIILDSEESRDKLTTKDE